MCLFFVRFGGKDEVLGYYRKLVKDEEVGWVRGGDVGQVKGWWGILERVDLLFRSSILELWYGFLCKRWAIA